MPEREPLLSCEFPRAIVHVDGDAFFTSVEQALHPALRGRPVVTGRERGIIACASYEAKAMGIARGISLREARRRCPELVILPSDYESYSLVSQRMFGILRRYTPVVEEYSIDEGFADITGMRGVLGDSYPGIAARMRDAIRAELDLTVSVGLSVSKGLAKIASDIDKPNGLTVVPGHALHRFLPGIALGDVWGLGGNRVALLQSRGLQTAWDYVSRPERWIRALLHKPGVDIWHELRGVALLPVVTAPWQPVASISKSKTFSAPLRDPACIHARLVRNLESAFLKLRRHHLRAGSLSISLRLKDYRERALEVRLERPVQNALEVTGLVRALFERLYMPGAEYRATGVVLGRLAPDAARQMELFEDPDSAGRTRRLTAASDRLQRRYGKHAVFLGPGLATAAAGVAGRDTPCWRRTHLLRGETARKRICLPLLDMQV